MTKYPRLYISEATHEKVKKMCAKKKIDMKSIGDKIARAGIKALGL